MILNSAPAPSEHKWLGLRYTGGKNGMRRELSDKD